MWCIKKVWEGSWNWIITFKIYLHSLPVLIWSMIGMQYGISVIYYRISVVWSVIMAIIDMYSNTLNANYAKLNDSKKKKYNIWSCCDGIFVTAHPFNTLNASENGKPSRTNAPFKNHKQLILIGRSQLMRIC